MKPKNLNYKLEKQHLILIEEDADFAAMVQVGRFLNAFEVTMEAVREIYIGGEGYARKNVRQAAAILTRIGRTSAQHAAVLKATYKDEAFFSRMMETFEDTEVRDVKVRQPGRLFVPEFRLVSDDPQIVGELHRLDIIGQHILFPKTVCEIEQAWAEEAETHYEMGRYQIMHPRANADFQMLGAIVSYVADYTESAAQFIKGIAKQLNLKDPDAVKKGTAKSREAPERNTVAINTRR